MKPQRRKILERYERTSEGTLIIDISAQKVEDLYNNFDKRSNFLKKDLDEELSEYLGESAREIGDEHFLIRITLEKILDVTGQERVRSSFKNYFYYMGEAQKRKMAAMARTSMILLAIGAVILTLSILLNQQNEQWQSVVGSVFAEGLTVAAWVSLWEALATYLIEWIPHKKKIRLFHRLAESELRFAAAP